MILIYFIISIVLATLVFRQSSRDKIVKLTKTFAVFQLLFCFYTASFKDSTEIYFFTYDALGIVFFAILSLLTFSTLYFSFNYLDNETILQYRLYFTSFIILCATITGAYFSNNATISWILIEATTLAAALLIYHKRTPHSLEAAWKYVFVCSIGIALAYLGILFLSVMLKGQHNFNMSYDSLRQVVHTANPLHLKIAFVLIFIGYSAKMEVFPLYSIGIDANHMAPTPISAFFSTALVNLGFVSIFRIYSVIAVSEIATWAQNVMMIAGVISILVAAVYFLQVRHYKRLFSYSTVENMGIVLIALSFGKIGCFIAVFHTLVHSFIKSTSFYSLAYIGKIYDSYRMERMGGLFQIYPMAAIVLLLCTVGVLALPPSPLFVSELMLFKLIVSSKDWILLSFLGLLLCLVLYAFLSKLLHIVYSSRPRKVQYSENKSDIHKIYIQIAILVAFFFFGIFQPEWFTSIIWEIVSFYP